MTTSDSVLTPVERRRFQYTNLDGNNNKYYLVETWALADGTLRFRATYGRVGAAPQVDEKSASPAWVAAKIREKIAKGYREVALHSGVAQVVAAAPSTTISPTVQQLVSDIFSAAGERIASYLAVSLDGLAPDQIAHGRRLLQLAQARYASVQQSPTPAARELLSGTIEQYYNAIPTQLEHRIDRETIVGDFCRTFDEQEDRLNQLEAAVATLAVQQHQPQISEYDALGVELVDLSPNDVAYGTVVDLIARTSVHGYKVRIRNVFAVTVPREREAFTQNTRGRNQVVRLFHGTGSHNVRHIMRSGLICPRTPSNGRMFGHGIYFANRATKSTNYCSANGRGAPHFLFLADVALGRSFVATDAMTDLRAAPAGHDSVHGKAGHTGAWLARLQFDEFIVYHAPQQTLRYVVTFDR